VAVFSIELHQRQSTLLFALSVDKIVKSFGLQEVELAIEKRAFCEISLQTMTTKTYSLAMLL
jgi:hypothetical protein